MYAFCLILSVIATALGLLAIGFGLSPYEGSLGNATLMAGSVGVVGGMVMFGIAAAIRQLRRIADALGPRPAVTMAATTVGRRPPAPEVAEAPPAPRQGPAPRVPYPPRPAPPDQREARFEQRAPAPPPPPPDFPEAPPPMERSRFGAARATGEAPMVEEPDAVPLAPARVPAPPMARGAPSAPEPPRPPEPRPTQADTMARLSSLAAAPPRPAPRPEPPPPPVERPIPAERPEPADQRRPNMFDALWPAEVRAARQSQPETIARAPRPEPRMDARMDMRMDPRAEPRPEMRAEPRLEPKLDARPEPRPDVRPEAKAEPRFEPPPREPAAPPAELRPIAILKSGVIDGMAYTLYTDGSIEAELPQGTMRFASIDDLRAHLEKADRQ